MFEAPEILMQIPEINNIYRINEKQKEEMDKDRDILDANIMPETMSIDLVQRWEKILRITPGCKDTLQERRLRIYVRLYDRKPYTLAYLRQKIQVICPEGSSLELNEDMNEATVKLHSESEKVFKIVDEMLDDILPINFVYKIGRLGNTHGTLANYPNVILSMFTNKELALTNIEESLTHRVGDLERISVDVLEKNTCEIWEKYGVRRR